MSQACKKKSRAFDYNMGKRYLCQIICRIKKAIGDLKCKLVSFFFSTKHLYSDKTRAVSYIILLLTFNERRANITSRNKLPLRDLVPLFIGTLTMLHSSPFI